MLNHWAARLGRDVGRYSAGSAPSGRINPHRARACCATPAWTPAATAARAGTNSAGEGRRACASSSRCATAPRRRQCPYWRRHARSRCTGATPIRPTPSRRQKASARLRAHAPGHRLPHAAVAAAAAGDDEPSRLQAASSPSRRAERWGTLPRKLLAEALGTALLLAVVIGSGIMAERLAGGNVAIALLANTLATVGGLYVLIEVFGPVSGAHINPAVIAGDGLRAANCPKSALRPTSLPSWSARCSAPGWPTRCSTWRSCSSPPSARAEPASGSPKSWPRLACCWSSSGHRRPRRRPWSPATSARRTGSRPRRRSPIPRRLSGGCSATALPASRQRAHPASS